MLLDDKILLPLPFMFFSFFFWTTGGSRKGSMKQGLSILPSFCPSFRLSGRFLELYHWFFLNFGMVLEIHMKLCVTEPDFPEKFFFCPKNWENGPKMGQKQGFFEFIENFCD